jgi:predicted ArsR family transcriptional regulator
MAEALGRPSISVRHHLEILLERGLIRTTGVQRRKARGRPRHIYELTETAKRFFPQGYEGLAAELLNEMKHILPPPRLEAFFTGLATKTASTLETNGQESIEERLGLVTHFLCERGYLARWEKREAGGYLLHMVNCPYEGLSAQHGELCMMDLALISELLELTPRRVAHSVAGDHRCTYLIE